MVKYESERDGEVEDVEALGTDVVGENLQRVRDDEWREGNTVRGVSSASVENSKQGEGMDSLVGGVVQEDEGNDGVRRRLVAVDLESGGADRLQGEEEGHTDDRDHEHEAPSEALDQGGSEERPGEIPYLEDTVDEQLRAGIC